MRVSFILTSTQNSFPRPYEQRGCFSAVIELRWLCFYSGMVLAQSQSQGGVGFCGLR